MDGVGYSAITAGGADHGHLEASFARGGIDLALEGFRGNRQIAVGQRRGEGGRAALVIALGKKWDRLKFEDWGKVVRQNREFGFFDAGTADYQTGQEAQEKRISNIECRITNVEGMYSICFIKRAEQHAVQVPALRKPNHPSKHVHLRIQHRSNVFCLFIF